MTDLWTLIPGPGHRLSSVTLWCPQSLWEAGTSAQTLECREGLSCLAPDKQTAMHKQYEKMFVGSHSAVILFCTMVLKQDLIFNRRYKQKTKYELYTLSTLVYHETFAVNMVCAWTVGLLQLMLAGTYIQELDLRVLRLVSECDWLQWQSGVWGRCQCPVSANSP